MHFDILIINGMVVDGSGAQAYHADIGIQGTKIARIGNLAGSSAESVIDAAGQVVSPGFIDIQNHSDSYGALFADTRLESMLHQGITTTLVGQCGSSLAPLLKGSLFSIRKWADISGVNVSWKSMREFLMYLSGRPLGCNIATLVGHATLRRDFVGDETRPLRQKEAKQIAHLYEKSLRQGAWGLSVGLEYSHGRVSDEHELKELLSITKKRNGVASFHLRDEGAGIESSLDEVLFLAGETGARTKIAHFKIRNELDLERGQRLLARLDKARKEGVSAFFDVYPYTISALVLYLLLPEWATEGGRVDLLEKLSQPEIQKEIIVEMRAQEHDFDAMYIASSALDRTLIGKSIGMLAHNQDISPEEVVLHLIQASHDQTIVFVKNNTGKLLELFMRHPAAMIATNGSGWGAKTRLNSKGRLVHPRSFGSTARVLGTFVREKKILSIEEAVYKMSGLPAEFLGLKDRGTLEKNAAADVVIFDPQQIADHATLEHPYQYPAGITHVVVNGTLAVHNERTTHTTAGQVLTK